MNINLLPPAARPVPVKPIIRPICIAPQFDTTPIGDFVFVLMHIRTWIFHTDDLGGFGCCLIGFSERGDMERYRYRHGLTEFCDILCYRREFVVEVCSQQGHGLAINNRVILSERVVKEFSFK